MPFNDAAKNTMVGALATSITHIGLHTFVDPGTGTNAAAGEVSGGSPAYARQAITWSAASAGQDQGGTALLTFDIPPSTDVGFVDFFTASTGNTGTYRGYAPLNSTVRGFGCVDAGGVTANEIDSSAHGLSNTDRVMVYNVLSESLPAGLTEGVIYFVVGATTDTFQVSLTSGGAAVDITGVGELYFRKTIPITSPGAIQSQVTIAINALTLDAQVI